MDGGKRKSNRRRSNKRRSSGTRNKKLSTNVVKVYDPLYDPLYQVSRIAKQHSLLNNYYNIANQQAVQQQNAANNNAQAVAALQQANINLLGAKNNPNVNIGAINDAKLNMGIAASLLENQPRRVPDMGNAYYGRGDGAELAGGAKKRRSNKRK